MTANTATSPIPFAPIPQVLRTSDHQKAPKVTLPHLFTPRVYQTEDLFRPLFPHHYPDLRMLSVPRKKRILLLWHRRAGKDLSMVNAITLAAYEELGNYLYLLPEQTQAKKIIWRGISGDGHKFIDRIPQEIIRKKYESEMLVELVNGSTIQIGGSDRYDSWMGTNPRGIIFSEYSLQDPMAWTYFRPILVENGGWAVFIYTARGKNHGYDLYNTANNNPATWHCSKKTIDDTKRPDGQPVVTKAQYLAEIEEGMAEAMARQEFYCDFEAALVGSYYGDLMEKARLEGRIGHYPYDPAQPVFTAWDLGNDANVVVFAQATPGGDPRVIDYYEEPDTPFTEVCKEVLQKPYTYASHFAPHDIKNRDHESNTRLDTARDLGIDFVVTPRGSRENGIEAVRQLLPRTQFHEATTERFRDVLISYHRVYDDKLKTFREQPVHDWACLPRGTRIKVPGGDRAVEKFNTGDKVLIAGVEADVVRAERVGVQKMIGLTLPNRVIVRCSEDHKIFTARGLVKAKDIRLKDELLTEEGITQWLVNRKGIREAFIESFKELNTDTGKIETCTSVKQEENSGSSTASYGSIELGLSRKNMPLFQLMGVGTISPPTIGFVDHVRITVGRSKQNMRDRSFRALCTDESQRPDISHQKAEGRTRICIAQFGRHIMGLYRKGLQYTTLITTRAIIKLKTFSSSLSRTTQNFTPKRTSGAGAKQTSNSFGKQVKSLRVLNVRELPPEEVFDIEVAHHHAYVLAESGVVTSNSHGSDAFRIMATNWSPTMIDTNWLTQPLEADASWVV